jgi:hypothetical protein
MACGGCCNPQSHTYSVDPTKCEPQLVGSYACNGPTACSWTVEVPCFGEAGAGDAGTDAGDPCTAWCKAAQPPQSIDQTYCTSMPIDGGPGMIANCGACAVGRPPRGFTARAASAPSAAGEQLAQMAQLEEASVSAFDALHADLVRLAAPRGLLRSVLAARRDEVRHARVMAKAAERYGATVPRANVAQARPRSLEQLAVENAEEGCVRETFGAAVAAIQATHARDAGLRRSMQRIARDELRHAALSWRLAAWFERRLDADGRDRVARARRAAVAQLEAELAVPCAGVGPLGLPDSRGARAAFDVMSAALAEGTPARAA